MPEKPDMECPQVSVFRRFQKHENNSIKCLPSRGFLVILNESSQESLKRRKEQDSKEFSQTERKAKRAEAKKLKNWLQRSAEFDRLDDGSKRI